MRIPLTVAIAAVTLVLAPGAAQAADATPCGPQERVSWSGTSVQSCPLSGALNGKVPVYRSPVAHARGAALPPPAGWLNGTSGQRFVCQREFPAAEYYHPAGYRNRWWAYTKSDDGVWGWTPQVFFRGGGNDEPDRGLARCVGGSTPKPGSGGPGRPTCTRYAIFGLRGSGEAYSGPHRMGTTVGDTAKHAGKALKTRSVRYFSIPYPAAEVIELAKPGGRLFWQSMGTGQFMLKNEIKRSIRYCPKTKIAVIGYSQGAGVASEALRGLSKKAFKQVRVAGLFADTYSAGQGRNSLSFDYFHPNRRTPFKRKGHGIFGSKHLPKSLRWKIDVCFGNDLVCDAAKSNAGLASQALVADIHTRYKDWAPRFARDLPSLVGGMVAEGLKKKR